MSIDRPGRPACGPAQPRSRRASTSRGSPSSSRLRSSRASWSLCAAIAFAASSRLACNPANCWPKARIAASSSARRLIASAAPGSGDLPSLRKLSSALCWHSRSEATSFSRSAAAPSTTLRRSFKPSIAPDASSSTRDGSGAASCPSSSPSRSFARSIWPADRAAASLAARNSAPKSSRRRTESPRRPSSSRKCLHWATSGIAPTMRSRRSFSRRAAATCWASSAARRVASSLARSCFCHSSPESCFRLISSRASRSWPRAWLIA